MNHRFAKAFHLLSVLLFIVIFMYIYSALPTQVSFEVDANGLPLKVIDKDIFFYIGIGAFVILNVLLITPAKMIENKATPNFRRLFQKGDPFKENMLAWIYSFVAVLNVSIIIIALYIHGINGIIEEKGQPSPIGLYCIAVFFVIWIVALFVILSKKMKAVQSHA
ncbi:DNA topoisomerase IV [Echinicola sp. 20G]|uniref:DNA topoisomerase IV n=1 Tax=Echinicola sp. 20G TaxID=2781961 RepID=UPI0019105B7B|nr:DNA topoisomerase IV [Echinicola sp. 20G]